MAKYLSVADDSAEISPVSRIIQRAKTAGDAAGCWQHIFATYFKAADFFLCYHITSQHPTISGRKLSAVTHFTGNSLGDAKDGNGDREDLPNSRVVVVELMDVDDQQLSWDASRSAVYSILSGADVQHQERSSLGALAAGEEFVLFEVTGSQPPRYLIGDVSNPARLLDPQCSLQLQGNFESVKERAGKNLCKAVARDP